MKFHTILKSELDADSSSIDLKSKIEHQEIQLKDLSTQILDCKQSLWKSLSTKQWLESQTKAPPTNPASFLSDSKSKHEITKGTSIDRVIQALKREYEKYTAQSGTLKSLTFQKENLLQTYKKITNTLTQENSIHIKLKTLRDCAEQKEKNIISLEAKAKDANKELESLRSLLNASDIKVLVESKQKVLEDLAKCVEDQKRVYDEIQATEQLIQTEKKSSTVSVDAGNKYLKQTISDIESQISNTVKLIKLKEKELRSQKLEKITPKNQVPDKIRKSLSSSNISFTKNQSTDSVINSPMLEKASRNKLIAAISKKDKLGSDKIHDTLKGFGSKNQSIASKIVLLNRGNFLDT